jgi:hypothetical protein
VSKSFLAVFLAISTTLFTLAGCSGGNGGGTTASASACLGCGTAGSSDASSDEEVSGSANADEDSTDETNVSKSQTDVDSEEASADDEEVAGGENSDDAEGNVLSDTSEGTGCEYYENSCDGECVDQDDPENCGACGHACGAGEICASGECLCDTDPTGQGPIQVCDDACTDTSTDRHNCGGCGIECTFDCADGQCADPVEMSTAGEAHTCVVTTGGTVWCWGDNSNSQLGQDDIEFSSKPIRVPEISGAMHVAAGSSHTCVLTRFENETGEEVHEVRCWGANDQNQLGIDGPSEPVSTPTLVQNLVDFDENGASLKAGPTWSCVVVGRADICWGMKDPAETDPSETDFTCEIRAYDPDTNTPSQVWCWGNNDHGQLGNGTTTSSSSPTPVVAGLD